MPSTDSSKPFKLLVDADSCPVQIRAVVLRACVRRNLKAIFAADRPLPDVRAAIAEHTHLLRVAYLAAGGDPDEVRKVASPIRMDVVPTGENSADDHLAALCEEGDLGITRDIGLASRLIEKGARVVTDRGKALDAGNIAQRLGEKEVNSAFREAGLFETEQNTPLAQRDVRRFADSFQRALDRR